ncbi:MAG: methionyl-tRNA formyltransferase [Clostridia bacterium]|nr:methionyl-tRNA formyltransferase [Clostridia bacterium]
MKIMFMGTPDFAVESLNSLHNSGHRISAVITMPDKPKGRGHKLAHTPVYDAGVKIDARVYTPENLKKENFEDILLSENPDVIVVVAYGKILPEYILEYPKYGCINVHASLLPQYRGAAPIQRSIIDGNKKTGVTTMYMEKGLDTGDMLLKSEVEITDDDNFATLHDKLALCGAELIVETLRQLEDGKCVPQKQNDSDSTYAHMITKETTCIDWNDTAHNIHNLIRGLYPVPKAQSTFNSQLIKFGSSSVSAENCDFAPGTVYKVTKDSILVVCGNSTVLEIFEIQLEGKKMMKVSDFLKGNSIETNVVLGS